MVTYHFEGKKKTRACSGFSTCFAATIIFAIALFCYNAYYILLSILRKEIPQTLFDVPILSLQRIS